MINSKEDIWVFPPNVNFEMTAGYTKRYRDQGNKSIYFFDLTETISLHSSFVGFLISIKHDLEKNGGRLILNTSHEIDELFSRMKIIEYFSSSKSVKLLKKTA
jgi:hypothetical protein